MVERTRIVLDHAYEPTRQVAIAVDVCINRADLDTQARRRDQPMTHTPDAVAVATEWRPAVLLDEAVQY
jgi:hypothetical protein